MRDAPAHGLSEKAVTIFRLEGVLRAGMFSLPIWMFAVPLALHEKWIPATLLVGLAAVLLLFFAAIRPPILGRIWRYEIGEYELYLQHGWLIVSRQLIPLVRIQNVDTAQGPVERYFGLSSVTVSTAGGVVRIPSLEDTVAHELRARIAQRVRANEHEVPDA